MIDKPDRTGSHYPGCRHRINIDCVPNILTRPKTQHRPGHVVIIRHEGGPVLLVRWSQCSAGKYTLETESCKLHTQSQYDGHESVCTARTAQVKVKVGIQIYHTRTQPNPKETTYVDITIFLFLPEL